MYLLPDNKMNKTKKKIAVLTTSYPRGIVDKLPGNKVHGPFVHEPNVFLKEEGCDFTVLAPHDRNHTKTNEEIDGIDIQRFNYFWPFKYQKVAYGDGIPTNLKQILALFQLPFFIIFFLIYTLKIGRKCDFYHAHWGITGFIAVIASFFIKKPIVLSVYGADILTASGRRMNQFTLNRVNHVIFNSNFTKESTEKIYSFSCPRTVVYASARFKDIINSSNFEKINYEEIANWTGDYTVVMTLGRFINRMGFEYLINALPKIRNNVKIVIGGEGIERKNLEDTIRSLNLEKEIHLPGRIPEEKMVPYFSSCDIFVYPQIIDNEGDVAGLGLVLIEAMLLDKPVIGTQVGGIQDIIEDGRTGLFVPQRDSAKLAEAIDYLIDNPKIRKKLVKDGYNKARTVFDTQKNIEKISKIYSEIC